MALATILLVDDDPVNLSVFRAMLRKGDYEFVSVDSGEEAMAVIDANPSFDLILLDVNMPGVNGIEVCRTLKNSEKTAQIPIVMISAVHTDSTSIREGLEAGADGYLTKPVEGNALRAWVDATLRISRLQRALQESRSGVPADDDELLEHFCRLSHAVNNPLQALFATTDMLALEVADNTAAKRFLTDIFTNAEKVANMVATASIMAKERLDARRGDEDSAPNDAD